MMKTSCRKMERKWRLSGLTVNYEAWKDCLQEYKVRIVSARSDNFSKMFDDNQRNPRQLFNSINKLLKCNSYLHVTASTHLCNNFLDFFATKIDNVRKGICASISLSSPSINVSYSGTVFSHFCTLDSYSLQKEVSQMKPVTSLLDPIPTSLFQSCFASLCPVVLSIINDSLCTGVVPPSFKIAAVTPVPKKTNVDYENLSNFRPISNLPFLVKILERVVASQLISHLTENNLFEPLQSGFRKFYSTETALVKVTNDLLIASDSGYFSILILLDLSAAFDTVDHLVLITRLETDFGVSDIALNWFRSYLSDRKQFVSMGRFRSKIYVVQSGVPQGSILGPLLFNIYIFTLGQLLRSLGLKFHLYADDTQIYIHTKPNDTVSVDFLSTCISKIKEWMSQNFLCLNSEKTEVMLIGSPHQLRKAGSITLSVDGSIMKFKTKLKNLGVIFDSNLTFEPHVLGTVKTYFFSS